MSVPWAGDPGSPGRTDHQTAGRRLGSGRDRRARRTPGHGRPERVLPTPGCAVQRGRGNVTGRGGKRPRPAHPNGLRPGLPAGPTCPRASPPCTAGVERPRELAACSGVVPVLCVVHRSRPMSGPALMLGIADVVVMTREAFGFVSGPGMVAEFTGVRSPSSCWGVPSSTPASRGWCAIVAMDVVDRPWLTWRTFWASSHPTQTSGPRAATRRSLPTEPTPSCRRPSLDPGHQLLRRPPDRPAARRRRGVAGALDAGGPRSWSPASVGSAGDRWASGQPAPDPGGDARHRRLPEGGPVRPVLRRVQPAPGDPGRHPGLPARRGPRVAGDDPPRGQLAFAYAGPPCPGCA